MNARADPKFGGSEKRTDRLKQFALLDMPTKDGSTKVTLAKTETGA